MATPRTESEEDVVIKLIRKYNGVFTMLCENSVALSLIVSPKANVKDDIDAPSTRMIRLFKCYLFAYTDENPFSANAAEVIKESSRKYLSSLNKLPYYPNLNLNDPGAKDLKPTIKEWNDLVKVVGKKIFKPSSSRETNLN